MSDTLRPATPSANGGPTAGPFTPPTAYRLRVADLRRSARVDRAHRAFGAGMVIMLFGYAILDRGFAYVKPPGPIFFSEVVIVLGLLWVALCPAVVTRAVRFAPQLWTLLAFMAYGAILAVPGLPVWGFAAARDSALWYYGTVSILVAASVLAYPSAVETALRWYSRFLPLLLVWLPIGVYLARRTDLALLPSGVSLFSSKSGNAAVHAVVALAFLLLFGHRYFRRDTRIALTALALVDSFVASTQARGGLLSLMTALVLLGVLLGRKRGQAIVRGTIFLVVLGALLLATGLSVPTARDREISADQFVDNFASILSGGSGEDSNLENTADWRRDLWSNVYNAVGDEEHVVFGFGFGPNLGGAYLPRLPREVRELRTPHNSHLNVYARMGVVGAGLWLVLWGTFFVLVGTLAWRGVRNPTTESVLAGICVIGLAAMMINAIVDPTMEGPQVAFWAWALHGFGTALWIRSRMRSSEPLTSWSTKPVDGSPVRAVATTPGPSA